MNNTSIPPSGRRRASRWLCAIALLAMTASGGGSDEPKGEQCGNDDSPAIPGPPDTSVMRGEVVFEERITFDGSGGKTVVHSASADLTDFSKVIVQSRQPTAVGTPACYGLTGSPTTVCRPGIPEPCVPEGLDVDKVLVSGLLPGSELPKGGKKGFYTLDGDPASFYSASEVKATVQGRTDPGYFPSMEVQVGVPDRLEIVEPAPNAKVGARDLTLRWKKGNGDYVVIDISNADGTTTDKIVCVVLDDGCHTILAGDLEFYDMKPDSKVKISVLRERSKVTTSGTASLEAKAYSRVTFSVVR